MRIRTLIMVAARRTFGFPTVLWALGVALVCSALVGVTLSFSFGGSLGRADFAAASSGTPAQQLAVAIRSSMAICQPNVQPQSVVSLAHRVDDLVVEWSRVGASGFVINAETARALLFADQSEGRLYPRMLCKLGDAWPLLVTLERLRSERSEPNWVVYVEAGWPFAQQAGCFVHGYKKADGSNGISKRYDDGVFFAAESSGETDLSAAQGARPIATQIKPFGLLLNVLCYAGVMLLVVGTFNSVRVAQRDARGCCVFCGYPRGPGRCPECGGVAGASS